MKHFNYIALEGADGTGKTTLAKELAEQINAIFTYEPNGDSNATKMLRELALQKEYKLEVNAEAREYIMLANRAISTDTVRTLLVRNHKVVQDRSAISGMVYAHVASDYNFDDWWTLAEKAFKVVPNVVVHVTTAKQNIEVTKGDIYDDEKDSFHSRIKETFPQVLEWFSENRNIPYFNFHNDFSKTPQENAQRLIAELTSFENKLFDSE